MHREYWSNSKLANWIRGTTKPNAATSKEWRDWDRAAKAARPIRYWIAEEALQWVQDVLAWPSKQVNSVRYYIKNRFFDKTHYLPTRLEVGCYHDVDTRVLHGMFETLVDFVEIEKAWMCVVWDEEARKKFVTPWWTKQWWTRFSHWRSPEAGIAHLDWEIGLGNPLLSPEERCEHQARDAKEVKELYLWWKNVRPIRPDPYDASGFSKECKEQDKRAGIQEGELPDFDSSPPSLYEASQRLHLLEQQYDEEDEQMMIRLIKIRKYLWT